jgi:hypothetical protein
MGYQPLERRRFEAALLPPPRLQNEHKRKLFELCGPLGGTIGYSRWAERPLPQTLGRRAEVEVRADVYDYPGTPGLWHVNFADPRLFVAYGSGLLAQDELQAVEHPALGPLREALLGEKLSAITEDGEHATPVLVVGVERRCQLDTSPDVDRPLGLYGNRFARAPFESVRSALTLLDPPTRSNLIAMAAPVGQGRHTLEQLERILATAHTAFAVAAAESRTLWPDAAVEVRTGFWGCGAFGGNRTVMVLLQIVAAHLGGVDRVVFHTVDPMGVVDYEQAVAALPRVDSVAELLRRVEARGYAWGVSDGN